MTRPLGHMAKLSAAGLGLCLALSGCFFNEGPYPEAGRGGFAEWQSIESSRALALKEKLDGLQSRGAELYQAAAYAEASLLLTRCRREYAAELKIDAEADLDRLELQIKAMDAAAPRPARRKAS